MHVAAVRPARQKKSHVPVFHGLSWLPCRKPCQLFLHCTDTIPICNYGKSRRSWRTQKYLLSHPFFTQQIIAVITQVSKANCIMKMGNFWRSILSVRKLYGRVLKTKRLNFECLVPVLTETFTKT